MHTQVLIPSNDTLITAQSDMELRASKEGYDRYIKQQTSAEANLGVGAEGVKIIRGCIPLVSSQITQWIGANDKAGQRGKRHAALAVLKTLDPDLLAFLCLNNVFTGITNDQSATAIHIHVGGQVEAEVMAQTIEDQQGRKVSARLRMVTSSQGTSRNRQKVFNKLSKEHLPEHRAWTQDIKVRMAEPLVNAVLVALPDLFELKTLPKGVNNRITCIRLTDAGVQMFGNLRESMAWMQPIHRPMVVPPRPWTDMDTGCYYEPRISRTVQLVRSYNKDHKKLIRDAIANGQMDYVMKSVNAIQGTAWTINLPILDLVRWCFDKGISGLGIAPNRLLDIPAKLDSEVWSQMSPQDQKGHRMSLGGIHERNRGIVSDQAVLLRDMDTADELTRYQRFWLPHNLDFRGRVYPIPHFSNQRADHIKAMFQFSDGEALGEFGIGWLSVHLANCGDFEKVSKKTFDDRLQWVEDNEFLILSVGRDPYATVDQWKEADSPLMFVAACMEYALWVSGGRSDNFVSHLAVALDGSNSGLQHYSAALRAGDEAALVSLTPSEMPADLYQTIADAVKATVEKDAAEGNEVAQRCLDVGITRSLVKRNVMTFAYSSEQFGFRQQLMDDVMRPINDDVFLGRLPCNPYAIPRINKETGEILELDGGFSASGYLASKVWQAVTTVVTKATEGMEFFKKVASTLAHERLPLVWTTPLGLPVMHRYSIWETKTVQLFLFDRALPVTEAKTLDKPTLDGTGVLRRVEMNIRTVPLDRINKDKARSAVAPNVIHSMDGAHLMLTVLNAAEEGMMDFALIHDSFGVHAGRTQRFFQIIRESFVEMYEDYCPFEAVMEFAQDHLSEEGIAKLPPLPTKGDMDLNVVLDASYAFA
jgi:DNA-directed RNA polymerase